MGDMLNTLRALAQFPGLAIFEDAQRRFEVLAPRDVLSGIPTGVVVRVGHDPDRCVDLRYVSSDAQGARMFSGVMGSHRYVVKLRGAREGLTVEATSVVAL